MGHSPSIHRSGKAEILLTEKRVAINGQIAQPGEKADPELDKIYVDRNISNILTVNRKLVRQWNKIIPSTIDCWWWKAICSEFYNLIDSFFKSFFTKFASSDELSLNL